MTDSWGVREATLLATAYQKRGLISPGTRRDVETLLQSGQAHRALDLLLSAATGDRPGDRNSPVG